MKKIFLKNLNLELFLYDTGMKYKNSYQVYDLNFVDKKTKTFSSFSLIGENVLNSFRFLMVKTKQNSYFLELEKPISTKKFIFILTKFLNNKKIKPYYNKSKNLEITDQSLLIALNKTPTLIHEPLDSPVLKESLSYQSNPYAIFENPKFAKFFTYISIFLTIIFPVILLVIYFFIKIKKTYVEYSALKEEQQISETLFVGHKWDDPSFNDYSFLIHSVSHLIKEMKENRQIQRNALIIGGPPGLGKSYMIRRIFYLLGQKIPDDFVIIRGSTNLSLDKIMSFLYKYNDRILVFDDFDDFFENSSFINIAKNLTELNKNRTIFYPQVPHFSSSNTNTEESKIPERFTFTGKLIFLTNLPKEKINIALLSRAGYIHVDFNMQKRIELLEKMMKYILPTIQMEIKKEVYTYILSLYKEKPKFLDFRFFENSICIRLTFPNWEEVVKEYYYSI